jgi:TetR/AcrR family transcriptional regulator, cholesterol catabolism regulator
VVIAPARAIADPEERLRSIIASHCRLLAGGSTPQGYNPVSIVVDEVAALTPAHRRKIVLRKRAYVDLVRNTLRQLKDEGKLKDIDVTVAAFSLLGMMLWLSRWFRPEGRLTPDQVVEELTKVALGGLLRPSARFAAR